MRLRRASAVGSCCWPSGCIGKGGAGGDGQAGGRRLWRVVRLRALPYSLMAAADGEVGPAKLAYGMETLRGQGEQAQPLPE